MTDDPSPRAVMQRYLDALVDGNLATIRDSFAEDATWWIHGDLPISKTWAGRDAIVDGFLVGFGGSAYEAGSQQFEFSEPIVDGDRLVLEWRVRARTAAGDDYDNAYCGVFRIVDGRIVEVREYLDSLYAARTLFAGVGAKAG